MKNPVATGCLILFILLFMPWSAYPQAATQGPRLVLQEREFDFGKVKEGSRITHEFTVQNKGSAPLEIKKVSPG
ncbi:MAG: DUF1573 domain-containing protein [Desulfobacteraceae bacterium]|nr:MAG: DUF1573 domain-containing protein [Desulfobacteraceae bacterium]